MLDLIDLVIRDLESRKDFTSANFEPPSGGAALTGVDAQSQLLALKQALLAHREQGTPVSPGNVKAALDTVTAVINGNLAQQQMGPLNAARTLAPELAAAHNRNLAAVREGILELEAQGSEPGPVQPPAGIAALADVSRWLAQYYPAGQGGDETAAKS